VGQCAGRLSATINDNLVVIVMIETLEGLKNADEIAKVPGITAVFAASGDLGNFSGFKMGDPDYERAINIVHDARSSGQEAVRSVRVERPPGFHLLPGRQRTRRHRARRERRIGRARQHTGQARSRPVRGEVILKAVQGSSHLC